MQSVGLLGENINYSKSPKLHNEYYKKNNIDFNYKLFDIKKEKLSGFIDYSRNNLLGFNITIPYKEEIIKYIDKIEYPANKIKAINTVVNNNGRLIGYNTDYFGFLKTLEEENVCIDNKGVLILGNGGAAKAIYYAIKDLKAKRIDFACRNIDKCKSYFNDANNIFDLNNITDFREYTLIVNATPLGNIKNNINPLAIKEYNSDLVLYDLNYIPKISRFLEQGKKLKLKVINGEMMLYYQAICAINIWLKFNELRGD